MIRPDDPDIAAGVLNKVANHPSVRPWLGGKGDLDLNALLHQDGVKAFLGAEGGFVACPLMAGIYEAHSLFLSRDAVTIAPQAIRYMFAATDCMRLVTKVPDGNERAAALARKVGFVEDFRRERTWPQGENMVGVSYQVLTLERWRNRDQSVRSEGVKFHEWLEAEKAKAGSPLPTHDEDEAHDRAVGAAMLMVKNGFALKGVLTYNMWATVAGYEPVELIADYPPVVDVRDAVVTLDGSSLRIVECR